MYLIDYVWYCEGLFQILRYAKYLTSWYCEVLCQTLRCAKYLSNTGTLMFYVRYFAIRSMCCWVVVLHVSIFSMRGIRVNVVCEIPCVVSDSDFSLAMSRFFFIDLTFQRFLIPAMILAVFIQRRYIQNSYDASLWSVLSPMIDHRIYRNGSETS